MSTPSSFDFDSFWNSGSWLKLGKKAAARHFNASVKTREDWNNIQLARDRYKVDLAMNKWKRPQHGSTWFNGWRDWMDTEREVEAIADDLEPIEKTHAHRCPVDEHEWRHDDEFCFMSVDVICEFHLNQRKAKAAAK